MSCGQKAWAEELEQEAWNKTVKRFREVPETQVIQIIQDIKDDLERFVESNPSLTRVQWSRVDSCLRRCKALV